MVPNDVVPFAVRVQHWNRRLVHTPPELKERQHVDWCWELKLLGNPVDDDWKHTVDDTGLGALFLGFARPTSAVEPIRAAACERVSRQ